MAANLRTPHKKSTRPGRQDMKAHFKYVMERRENKAKEKTSYLPDAKRLLDKAIWNRIVNDAAVSKAHAALLAPPSKKRTIYDSVSYLLNRISEAYIKYTGRLARKQNEAIVYSSPHNQEAPGDYLGAAAKADWISFMADVRTLTAALASSHDGESDPATQWAKILGISEGKPDPEGVKGQFLWYLSALKRYRCDLDSAHGFNLQGNDLFLASLNACGVWLSETSGRDNIELWVAHIVLLYDAFLTRDTAFSLHRGAEDAYVRWNVSLAVDDGKPEQFTVAPFNASHCPGRMTWVGFQLGGDPSTSQALFGQPVAGFFKTSWQDSKSVFSECQLFDVAHGYARPTAAPPTDENATAKPLVLSEMEWLPGLARHWPQSCRRDGLNRVIGIPGDDKGIRRVKEIVHLASVGEPLSRCKSSLHLLEVIFDAIGTHGLMVKRGVIHRDVSWYNVLCNAWHHPSTGNNTSDTYPSAEFILTGASSQPSSLIIDLDHGALMKTLYGAAYKPRKERTGTPMFVAIELSSEEGVEYNDVKADRLDRLVTKLRSIEDHKELFERAFPNYDGRFMTDFIDVVEMEKKRDPEITITTDPSTQHRPRHDVESFYWILLWALARACPAGCDPYGGDISARLLNSFSEFASMMLRHTLDYEILRPDYLFGWKASCANVLHPKLAHFGTLLQDMALFLSIPWHLYDEKMQDDHAHVAMQRLLILELHALCHEHAEFNVAFNILQPRVAKIIESEILNRQTQPTTTGLMDVMKVIALEDREDRTVRHQPARGAKRKSGDADFTEHYFAKGQLKKVKQKLASAAAEDVVPPAPRHPSPGELIRMFLDDRLWFGIGTREAQRAKDAE